LREKKEIGRELWTEHLILEKGLPDITKVIIRGYDIRIKIEIYR